MKNPLNMPSGKATEKVVAKRKMKRFFRPQDPDTASVGLENVSRDSIYIFAVFSGLVFAWGLACLAGAMIGGGLFDLALSWVGAVTGR